MRKPSLTLAAIVVAFVLACPLPAMAQSEQTSQVSSNLDASVARALELLQQGRHLEAFESARQTYSKIRNFNLKENPLSTQAIGDLGDVLNYAGAYLSSADLSASFITAIGETQLGNSAALRKIRNNLLRATLELGRLQDAGRQARYLLAEYGLVRDGDIVFAQTVSLMVDYCIQAAISCPIEKMLQVSHALATRELGTAHRVSGQMALRLAYHLLVLEKKKEADHVIGSISSGAFDPELAAGLLEFAADRVVFGGMMITSSILRDPRRFYEQALAIRTTHLGANHPREPLNNTPNVAH